MVIGCTVTLARSHLPAPRTKPALTCIDPCPGLLMNTLLPPPLYLNLRSLKPLEVLRPLSLPPKRSTGDWRSPMAQDPLQVVGPVTSTTVSERSKRVTTEGHRGVSRGNDRRIQRLSNI